MTAILFENGTIWQGADRETARALLVVDGVVVAVGADAIGACRAAGDAADAAGAADAADTAGAPDAAVAADARGGALADLQTVDLADGFLTAAFADGHAHPIDGGLGLMGPRLRECGSAHEVLREVARHAAEHPHDLWIRGAGYRFVSTGADGGLLDAGAADGGLLHAGADDGGPLDARLLDAVVADRPVALLADGRDEMWCNSAALAAAGITGESAEPALGRIVRRSDGSPSGVLRGWGAIELVDDATPPATPAARLEALDRAADHLLARGVASVQDARADAAAVDTHLAAARAGRLRVRTSLAFRASPPTEPDGFAAELARWAGWRDEIVALAHPLLTARTVAFFVDGVTESDDAADRDRDRDRDHDRDRDRGSTSRGTRSWTAEALTEAAVAADAAGFELHLHALGGSAVRRSLDTIAAVVDLNGSRPRRPVIAHAQMIDARDLRRFASLGVTACLQAHWALAEAQLPEPVVRRPNRARLERQYRMRSLLESGVTLSFGSDWPSSDASPLAGLGVVCSRSDLDGRPWSAEEVIDVGRGLDAYAPTGLGTSGRIDVGAAADLVVLDRDPRRLPPEELSHVRVVATFVAGEAAFTEAEQETVVASTRVRPVSVRSATARSVSPLSAAVGRVANLHVRGR